MGLLQNEHEWITGKCDHITETGEDLVPGPPTDADGHILQYFPKTGLVVEALKIVLDQRWIQSFKYYICFRYIYM